MINKKEKIIKVGITLIIIGFIISIVGFGLGGFNLNVFKYSDTQKWYNVIDIN